ncbi:MAG: SGNH/GDSL hydrolase family protein [Phycisphaerae bacterium]|nr:SGNH/GDSL hydrolase family protein [Phycisphaerae bacterium]
MEKGNTTHLGTRISHSLPLTAVCVLLILAGLEGVTRCAISSVDWFAPEEILLPGMVELKLDALKRHDGETVVLLGDSLILGKVLQKYRPSDWRSRTLDALLEAKIRLAYPGRNVKVMNLGMNGALPTDIASLGERVVAEKPSLIVMDIGLRDFSADFIPPEDQRSRPWLEEPSFEMTPTGVNQWINSRLQRIASRVWKTYAFRDWLHQVFFDGRPSEAIKRRLEEYEHAPRQMQTDADLLLLIKARKRFRSITLNPEHPQVKALECFLKLCQRREVPLVLFYAQEAPEKRSYLLPEKEYNALKEDLRALVATYEGPRRVYLPGCTSIPQKEYIDHVHVSAEGYPLLVEYLWPAISRAMDPVVSSGHDVKENPNDP